MLVGDEISSSKKSADDETQRKLEEIIEKISTKTFLKYSLKESRIISKGKSIYDVIQDKFIEFLQRIGKPDADAEADSKWIDRNINQGERKLYKNAENIDSLDDDENFNSKYLARDDKIQSNLEKYEIIQKILKNYNARNKLIVELRFFVELEDEEIAGRAQTTKGNVRKVACQFKKDCRQFGIKFSKNKQNKNVGGKNDGE